MKNINFLEAFELNKTQEVIDPDGYKWAAGEMHEEDGDLWHIDKITGTWQVEEPPREWNAWEKYGHIYTIEELLRRDISDPEGCGYRAIHVREVKP